MEKAYGLVVRRSADAVNGTVRGGAGGSRLLTFALSRSKSFFMNVPGFSGIA
jgi:hypothetical protein